jgi:prophage DNA circulation protein
MTWSERLRPTIEFVSPAGQIFAANWSDNQRSIEKQIGIFSYPKINGSITQDLGSSGITYPLTIFFDGPDNDVEADKFFRASIETGLWRITHPVRGVLNLQLLTITESISPIASGGVTQFITEWIEPISDSVIVTAPEIQAKIANLIDVVNDVSATQFIDNIIQTSAAATEAVQNAVEAVVRVAETNLSPLYESVSEINARVTSVISGIRDNISQPVIDIIALAGQVQNLIELPSLVVTDVEARLDAYSNFIDNVFDDSGEPTVVNKNAVLVQEISATSALVSSAQIASTIVILSKDQSSELTAIAVRTRANAIEIAGTVSDLFTTVTDTLDDIQTEYAAEDIDIQYFSQSSSFNDTATIIAQAISYILIAAFDLAIEKRFTLKNPRTPIDLAITEYDGLGEDDSNFNLFIESNGLKANDILLLPAGREVLFYV